MVDSQAHLAGEMTTVGRLEGRVALVTGGGTGIGRAAARLFAREGARVAVVGRRKGPLDETVRVIRDEGGIAVAIPADLSRSAQVLQTMRRVDRELGTLQVLFNNHGIFEAGTVENTTERVWDRILNVDLKAVFLTCRAAIPRLRRQGGSIINNASTLGLVGLRDAAAYCAA